MEDKSESQIYKIKKLMDLDYHAPRGGGGGGGGQVFPSLFGETQTQKKCISAFVYKSILIRGPAQSVSHLMGFNLFLLQSKHLLKGSVR